MENKRNTRIYFLTMAAYWLVFGLITAFYPGLMDLFQTTAGTAAKTAFSDHVWRHDGFDILSISVLLFALAAEPVSGRLLRAAATVAALVTFAIVFSLVTTPYWSPFFIVPCVGCFSFTVWGFLLARTSANGAKNTVVSTAS
jgi:hypothetical protein